MLSPMTAAAHLAPTWPEIHDGHLEVAGRRVRVLRSAARGDGPGEPQLLVHGLGGSSITWVEVMAGLSASGPVVAVDLPGFGRTPVTPDDRSSIDGYVDFLLEVADALGWDRFTVHGNSMGGLIATLLAARSPERVGRLVLVSPALPPSSPLRLLVPARATLEGMVPIAVSSLSASALGLVGAGALLDERRNRHLLRLIFAEPNSIRPELLDLMAHEFTAADAVEAADRRRATRLATRSIAALWTDPRRVWRAIDAVTAPTIVLGGTADALVPARVLRQVLARRTDWAGHVIDERRHALMLESPEEYLDLFDAWQHALTAAV